MELKCKHCGLGIVENSSGWVHVEGPQAQMHTCALNPYGFNAAPHGDSCDVTCNGHSPGLYVVESPCP